MEDGMNPPPSQAMTADPSVVAAAVRVCDDALASPTVEFLSGFGFGLKHKTVTIPVANPAGAKILSIVIEIPEYGVWHGSIVTAEGVCVARVSQKECLYPGGQWIDAPPVPIEWGGAHFGEVNHDFIRNPRSCASTSSPSHTLKGQWIASTSPRISIPSDISSVSSPKFAVFRVSASSLVLFLDVSLACVIHQNLISRTAPGRKSGASRSMGYQLPVVLTVHASCTLIA